MGRLDGKIAVIVGGGQTPGRSIGNGRATAIRFAEEGAKVLVVDRNESSAKETLNMAKKRGGIGDVFVADVTSAADCEAMVNAAVDRYGRLDILDNNVGISIRADVTEVTEEQWDKVMSVNVKSIMLAS